MYRNLLEIAPCKTCPHKNNCFLRKIPINIYNEEVQYFLLHYQTSIFKLDKLAGLWRADFEKVQNQIVEYYDSGNYELSQYKINVLTKEAQKAADRKRIKEEFKRLIEIAAKATEDKQLELSIALDGIGLILVSDYFEAVNKILSIFVKGIKIWNTETGNCSGYQQMNGRGCVIDDRHF